MYHIYDIQTSQKVAERKTLRAAANYCDKKDNEYGAVRYVYKWVG